MRYITVVLWLALALIAIAAPQGSWSEAGKPLGMPATVENPVGSGPLTLVYTDPAGKTSTITLSPGASVTIGWDAKRGKPMVRVTRGRVDWDLNSLDALDFSAPRQTVTAGKLTGYVIVESSDKLGGPGVVFIIGGTASVIVGTYFGLQSSTPVSPHQ